MPVLTDIHQLFNADTCHVYIHRLRWKDLSLSRLNYQWPEWEVHPEMMEGVAARPLVLERGLKG